MSGEWRVRTLRTPIGTIFKKLRRSVNKSILISGWRQGIMRILTVILRFTSLMASCPIERCWFDMVLVYRTIRMSMFGLSSN